MIAILLLLASSQLLFGVKFEELAEATEIALVESSRDDGLADDSLSTSLGISPLSFFFVLVSGIGQFSI